jgi:hypothetical protein
MKLNEKMTITKRSTDGAFYGEKNNVPYVIERSHADYAVYDGFYNVMRATPFAERSKVMNELIANNRYPAIFGSVSTMSTAVPMPKRSAKDILLEGIEKLMDFFSEFSFTPSFRFTNTFAFMACESKQMACDYVHNYFALMNSNYVKEVEQKIKSAEFANIIKSIAQYGRPTNHINTRLKVYYGSAGTGKTTLAQKESDNRCIVCNSSMLPADLMEDFIFKDGQPDFNPSLLWECMEQGKKVMLDEINLLPFDSLRFLQGIVDGKTEFYYKNRPVHIKDGFQIIGTMNLSLGGMTYGLPEPLVDRCSDTKEFVLTAEQLAKSIMGMDGE